MTDVNYVSTSKKSQSPSQQARTKHLPDSEAADPERVDHEQRRSTQLVHSGFDTHNTRKPLVECGCGGCSPTVDPLADENHAFRDSLQARDVCPSPQPMTVERASEAYLIYQRAAENKPDMTSLLEHTKNRYARLLGGDVEVRDRMDDPTLLFLSLRVSPIHRENGQRRWVHPVTLDTRLSDAWENVRAVLNYQLRDYTTEYFWITAATDSAATPHRHVLMYVEDLDDTVGIDVARSAVDSFVDSTQGAEHAFHPVEPEESDAGIVFHDPPLADQAMDNHPISHHEIPFGVPSVPIFYMANQMPHWSLKNVYDPTSDVHTNSTAVDGGATAWASPNKWIGSSNGFPM